MRNRHVDISYDQIADVMYVTVGNDTPNRYEEDDQGLVWRLNRHGKVFGVTIFDFDEVWRRPNASLTKEIARRLDVKFDEVDHLLARPAH